MRILLGLLALVISAPLYEDQVGVIDWKRELLGRTTHILPPASRQRRIAFVASEDGVVGAVKSRTGELGEFLTLTMPNSFNTTSLSVEADSHEFRSSC